MADSDSRNALIWAAIWFLGAVLLYFVVIPAGIEVPSYSTQSPALFPKAVAILIGSLAILQLVIEWRGKANKKVEEISIWFFVTPVVAGIFAWFLGPVGFPLTGCVALSALLVIFGERRPVVLIGITGVIIIGIHITFVYLLHIPLPVGILG
jgi:hypothetical protein